MGCDSGRFRFLLGSAGRGLCCVKAPFRAPTCTPTTYTGSFLVWQRASRLIKSFAVIGEGPLGILNDQDSLLATTAGCCRHWQSVESAAFRSWPFKIPSARVDQLHVSFFSKLFIFTLGGTFDLHGLQLRSSVGRGTLLRRAIRGNQLQSIDWVGSPWARRDPFR